MIPRLPLLALVAMLTTLCLPLPAKAAAPAAPPVAARAWLLMDTASGQLLAALNEHERAEPASLTKLMTAYLSFSALKAKSLKLAQTVPVSERAWRAKGSRMFIEPRKPVTVEELILGMVVQSGNDACIVLAEALGGSEEGFAQAMTERAREIGLTGSSFANATGWPHPEQRMTARDLATLALRTIENFPDYYGYYAETSFVWSDIKQGNRNPLLYKSIGADGLKTGHTEEAGYGLTGSAVQDGRRLILVINGLSSIKARAEESHRLLAWGFREFDNYALLGAGETVEEADVWQGELETVPLVLAEDLVVTLPRKSRSNMKVKVRYDGPVPSPIAEGQEIAALVVSAPEIADVVVPLLAGQAVERQGPVGRLFSGLRHMILGGS